MADPQPNKPCCCGSPKEETKAECCGSSNDSPKAAPCCGQDSVDGVATLPSSEARWVVGTVSTPVGDVPQVSTTLGWPDRLGAWKVRWAIGRMQYAIEPGLYAVGNPTADSPVMVSANYKMSFDRLRSQLAGRDVWILVLDTRGINVWCAAGKGTFGTDEIVNRVAATQLAQVVSHRRLIVPQLGAPGVAAHKVKQQSGFRVVYGPIRAEDLPAFLDADMNATPEMRLVRFPLRDRLAVVPVELVMAAKALLIVAVCLLLLSGLGTDGYSWARVSTVGVSSALLLLVAGAGGVFLTAALLPWLPGRALALKGAWAGVVILAAAAGCVWLLPGVLGGSLSMAAWCLLVPTVASFMAMNYTGTTTYTSLSGVRREMRTAVPLQVLAGIAGVTLWITGLFVYL